MDLEEDWFPYQTGHRLARHFAELISDIFRSIDGGHDPRYGIWNHPACLLCQCVISSEFTQRQKTTKSKTKHASTTNMNERKWQQPRLQLHLVTKSRGRRELGLPTSSAAVLPLKMMPCTMFRSVQTFYVNGKFTEHYHIFGARIDLFSSAHIIDRELQSGYNHFGFVICVNSRLYCMHFLCH